MMRIIGYCSLALLFGAAFPLGSLIGQTDQTTKIKPENWPVYRDSDFGFSFSYPPPKTPVGPPKIGTFSAISGENGIGRCVEIDRGFWIVACGDVFVSCLAGVTIGVTIENLKGSAEHYARFVKTHGGLVQEIHYGDNWFLGTSILSPNMFDSDSTILIRKSYAGGCLENYIQISHRPKDETFLAPYIAQILGSFHAGELDAMPPLEKRQGWDK